MPRRRRQSNVHYSYQGFDDRFNRPRFYSFGEQYTSTVNRTKRLTRRDPVIFRTPSRRILNDRARILASVQTNKQIRANRTAARNTGNIQYHRIGEVPKEFLTKCERERRNNRRAFFGFTTTGRSSNKTPHENRFTNKECKRS